MALIAKEVLKMGFVVAALPGNVVSPEAVKEYGWEDKVEDDGNGDIGSEPSAEPKKRASK